MPNWGAVFGWYTYNKTNARKRCEPNVLKHGRWPQGVAMRSSASVGQVGIRRGTDPFLVASMGPGES